MNEAKLLPPRFKNIQRRTATSLEADLAPQFQRRLASLVSQNASLVFLLDF
jgi:hypothetical protein